MIIGNLTRDPELKSLPSGTQVASMSIATNHSYKDARGEKQESVEFHNVVVFGKQAETSAQYLQKGQQVLIIGRIQTRSWDDKTSGEKKYRTEIIADRVQFGSKPSGASPETTYRSDETPAKVYPAHRPPVAAAKPKISGTDIEYPTDDINPEDIPF